jgi:hypothetical protein
MLAQSFVREEMCQRSVDMQQQLLLLATQVFASAERGPTVTVLRPENASPRLFTSQYKFRVLNLENAMPPYVGAKICYVHSMPESRNFIRDFYLGHGSAGVVCAGAMQLTNGHLACVAIKVVSDPSTDERARFQRELEFGLQPIPGSDEAMAQLRQHIPKVFGVRFFRPDTYYDYTISRKLSNSCCRSLF